MALIPSATAQDTLLHVNGERIIGQVEEILRDEIRYRINSAGNSVIVVVNKSELEWIHLAGGQRFQFGEGVWNDPKSSAFMKRHRVLSMDVFAPALDHITIGYEHLLSPGHSLVAKVGRIGVWDTDGFGNGLVNDGFLVKLGSRHALPEGSKRSSMLGSHLLAGWYIRPELMYSYWAHTDQRYAYGPFIGPYETYKEVNFYASAAVNIAVGTQVFLSERICMDFYAGLGYGISWRNGVSQPNDGRYQSRENYSFSHLFFGGSSPLCTSGGVLLGYTF
ncbi:MAG: hypothetical protein JNM62_02790 [Flavobacteriales bacterium]|nr:hypothetical protein [Flavobacteriales bacterium]